MNGTINVKDGSDVDRGTGTPEELMKVTSSGHAGTCGPGLKTTAAPATSVAKCEISRSPASFHPAI